MGGERSRRGWAGGVALALAGVAGYLLVLRPKHLRWGATDADLRRAMAGDEIVSRPNYLTNRAITIRARPEHIWPWLAQMGEGRGGFYSYTGIERLMGMRVVNAESILPEFQVLQVGELLGPRQRAMQVRRLVPLHALVLGPPGPQPWGDTTWSMELVPVDAQHTRLVSRTRARFRPGLGNALVRLLLDPGQPIMERRWLLGVKQRAERTAREARALQRGEHRPPPARA